MLRLLTRFSVVLEVVVHVRLVVDVLVLGDGGLGARGGVALELLGHERVVDEAWLG